MFDSTMIVMNGPLDSFNDARLVDLQTAADYQVKNRLNSNLEVAHHHQPAEVISTSPKLHDSFLQTKSIYTDRLSKSRVSQ
jgi:hypothetical protein